MIFGAEGATYPPPLVAQTTISQKIRLNEKHVLSEATPLQKRPCKKLFAIKVKKSRKFYMSIPVENPQQKIKNRN